MHFILITGCGAPYYAKFMAALVVYLVRLEIKMFWIKIHSLKKIHTHSGTVSILSMVVIGYDRYNVIVKGFSGTKITPCTAATMIFCVWLYSIAVCCPPFIGWGGYALGT